MILLYSSTTRGQKWLANSLENDDSVLRKHDDVMSDDGDEDVDNAASGVFHSDMVYILFL